MRCPTLSSGALALTVIIMVKTFRPDIGLICITRVKIATALFQHNPIQKYKTTLDRMTPQQAVLKVLFKECSNYFAETIKADAGRLRQKLNVSWKCTVIIYFLAKDLRLCYRQ